MNHSRRRLIVCCDGTWQRNDTDQPLTNVARISRCFNDCDERDTPPTTQILHYQSGVGTSSFAIDNLYEGAFAQAISREICEAYSFICDNYVGADDEIILIGFSRGAFTVRAVASLIYDVGILKGVGRYTFQTVYNLWEKQVMAMEPAAPSVGRQELNDRMSELNKMSPELRNHRQWLTANDLLWARRPIKACAVWDTVASLGLQLPGYLPQIGRRKLAFVNSRLCLNIENAFQALALEEQRFHFQPRLWVEHSPIQKLKQCWFLGSHGDVGGGNQISGLTNLSLTWMISELDHLVCFNTDKIRHLASDWSLLPKIFQGQKHEQPQQRCFEVQNSMTWGFWWAGSNIRKPGEYVKYREVDTAEGIGITVDSKETIHFSVRVLSNGGSDKRCQFLKDYTLNENAPYKWHSPQYPRIPEAIPNESELKILREWLKEERDRFGDEAGLRLMRELGLPITPAGLAGPQTRLGSAVTM